MSKLFSCSLIAGFLAVSSFFVACGDDSSSGADETEITGDEGNTGDPTGEVVDPNQNPVDPNSQIPVDPNADQPVTNPDQQQTVDPVTNTDPVTPTSSTTTGTAADASALPTNANAKAAQDMFTTWKARWIISLKDEINGGSTLDYDMYQGSRAKELLTQKMGKFYDNPLRVIWDGGNSTNCELTDMTTWGSVSFTAALRKKLGCTVSEGIGYGMLIALFHGDKDLFDGLWAYNIIARDNNNNGLMPWELQSFSRTVSTAAALDADLDVATALILASYKWSDDRYKTDAIELINAILKKGINMENLLIRPGDTWSNKDVYNLSYFSPVALRLFNQMVPGAGWDAVLVANYTYMAGVQAAGAIPLFPDWSNAAGQPTDPKNGSAASSYMLFDKESVRVPWRMAWDNYWYQSAESKNILTAMSGFINDYTGGDASKIPSNSFNYSTGELSTSQIVGQHYTGAYCLMGMGANPTWLNSCYKTFSASAASYSPVGYTGTYFKEILMLMYSTLMNGMFEKPAGI
ncbi:MAG: glycosyl hydrolase family 8 [Fibrobacter sp.]|nr:glycosyl hydrolase family 8 [Fibrobacter sp.]